MIEIKSRWQRITDREKWAARGASFAGKAKATKVVWFPPNPVDAGKKAASTTKEATKTAPMKTKGATKKTSNGTKSLTKPVRRKRT